MFEKGHRHNENWYMAMRGKPRPKHVKEAISNAQKGRNHTPQEGFQSGHKAINGTEKTRFIRGFIPWNKGKGVGANLIKLKYRTYKSNAKRTGKEFTVTLNQMEKFLKSKCVYCGHPATGIDRINNEKGYINGNMSSCCKICNHMKNNLTKEDFLKKCKEIVTVTGYEI